MFLDSYRKFNIIRVCKFSWDEIETDVAARGFSALCIRTKGSSTFIANNSTVVSDEKSILYEPEGVKYHFYSRNQNNIIVIYFNTDDKSLINFECYNTIFYERYLDSFETMLNIFVNKPTGWQYSLDSMFTKIVVGLQKEMESKKKTIMSNFKYGVSYLRENFANPTLTISEISKKAYISEVYFRKLFLATYGTSPIKFLTNLRLEHAAFLLTTGIYSVTQVSELSGFSSPKYFSNQFHRRYKVTPSSLLLKNRKGESTPPVTC